MLNTPGNLQFYIVTTWETPVTTGADDLTL